MEKVCLHRKIYYFATYNKILKHGLALKFTQFIIDIIITVIIIIIQ